MSSCVQPVFRLTAVAATLACATILAICPSALAQSKNIDAAGGINGALITATITGFIGGVGWIAAYVLNSQREDRTRRLQLTIEQASTQIREFYAPLVALTDQLNTLAAIKAEIVRDKSPDIDYDLTATFYDQFFLPIHEEINSTLKTKVHLLEGASTPSSFRLYFQHYASEKAYWRLVKAGKDVANMHVPNYPSTFYFDVRRGYQAVMDRYEASLQEMRHPRTAWLLQPRLDNYAAPSSSRFRSPEGRGDSVS